MAGAVGLAAFLAVWNNVVNRVPGHARAYVAVNLALAAGLVALARAWGLSWAALGLGGQELGRGLAVGAGLAVLVAAAYAVALATPRSRPLLADARVAGLGPRAVAFGALVRIPLGTVVLEEVAFRAVLLALWSGEQTPTVAVLASSAVFGLWHIVPTLMLLDANRVQGRTPRSHAVVGAVLTTAAAGVGLCALRLWTGSLAAPALVHLATNALGLLAAAAANRQPSEGTVKRSW